MKNKLTDLNNHLFAQLERLADEDLDADAIEREVKRAGAIVEVSDQVLPRLNCRWTQLSYDEAEPELKPYILAAAQLQHAAREIRKDQNK